MGHGEVLILNVITIVNLDGRETLDIYVKRVREKTDLMRALAGELEKVTKVIFGMIAG